MLVAQAKFIGKEKILVVDSEEDVAEHVKYNLTREGYRVDCVPSGEQALTRVEEERPDLILLDRMLPDLDGMDVCRELKSNPATRQIPIIMITARNNDDDIISGLESGAEDYVTKPFSQGVLLARLKAALRRARYLDSDEIAIVKRGHLIIDLNRHKVTLDGISIILTATEFEILYLLASSPGRVFSREQIIRAIKGFDYSVTERSVDVQIVSLRKKLRNSGEAIETVRGIGYRFKEYRS